MCRQFGTRRCPLANLRISFNLVEITVSSHCEVISRRVWRGLRFVLFLGLCTKRRPWSDSLIAANLVLLVSETYVQRLCERRSLCNMTKPTREVETYSGTLELISKCYPTYCCGSLQWIMGDLLFRFLIGLTGVAEQERAKQVYTVKRFLISPLR